MTRLRKKCGQCQNEKLLVKFHKDKTKSHGRSNTCKSCQKDIDREWYANNRTHRLKTRKEYRDNNLEKSRAICRNWRNNNLAHAKLLDAEKRARKRQRTVNWPQAKSMADIYSLAHKIKEWGCNVQVDHIIPLQHPSVCGLHTRDNLQILSAFDNNSKGNYYAQ